MNNFTKSSGRAYWHSITNLKCGPGLRELHNKSMKAVMLLMFFAMGTGALFAQNPIETVLDKLVDGCMHDVPVLTTDQAELGALMGAAGCTDDFHVVHFDEDGDGVLHVNSGFAAGSDNCSWTYYNVYDVKCKGTIQRWTLTYSGGDYTAPWLTDPKDHPIPDDQKDLNYCYDDPDRPRAPSADDIALLYSDNCSHAKGTDFVTKRTRTKNDDCSWIEITTYTINDTCKNNAFEVSITYSGGDKTIPTFDWTPGDLTGDKAVYCDDIPDPVELSWTDNCTDPGKVWSEDENKFDCKGGYILRTWNIVDDCNNVNSYTQKIEVREAKKVYFTSEPQDVDVLCADRANYASYFPAYLDYTNGHGYDCEVSGKVDATYDAPDLTNSCFSFDVTYTYDDECNSISHTITVTVVDDILPSIDKASDALTVECDGAGNAGDYQAWLDSHGGAVASDNCDTDLEWSHDADGRSLQDGCNDHTGRIFVTFIVKDDCGNESKTGNWFEIEDSIDPEMKDAIDERAICDGEGNVDQYLDWIANFGGAGATDVCDDNLDWSHNGPVPQKIEDKDKDTSYQQTLLDFQEFVVNCDGTYTGYIDVTFTATDDCDNYSSSTARFSIEDSIAPDVIPAESMTVECDGTLNFDNDDDINAVEDANGGGPSWSPNSNIYKFHDWLWSHGGATATDGCSEVYWKRVKDITGDACERVITVTFTAFDLCGNSTDTTASFIIEDTKSPIITEEAHDKDLECQASQPSDVDHPNHPFRAWLRNQGGATAYDACDDDLTWSNDYDRENWNDDCGNTRSVNVLFTVTDDCGLQSTTGATFAIVDTTNPVFDLGCQFDPLVIYTSDTNVDCPADATISLDEGDEISVYDTWTVGGYEIFPLVGCVSDNCTHDGDLIIRVTKTTNEKGDCSNTLTITFEAEDECGNISKEPFTCTYIIVDDTAPVLTGNIYQFNISDLDACEAPARPTEADIAAQFSDNCNTVIATYIGTVADPIVDECGWGVQFAYEIKDSCNNVYDGVVKVSYWGSDQTAPQPTEGNLPKGESDINSCLMDAIADNPGSSEADVLALFTDNCKDAKDLKIVKSDVIDDTVYKDYPNGCTWAFHYEFTVSDNCGNDYVVYENFSGEDKLAPRLLDGINLFDYNLSNVDSCINEEAGPSEDYIADLFIECGDTPGYGVNVDLTVHTTGTDCNWITSYEYEVYDDCGNYYPTFKITHSGGDDTGPVLSCPGDVDFGEVDDTPDFDESADYTDCSGDGTTYSTKDESDHYHDNTGSSVITVDINCYGDTFVTFIQTGTSGGYATYSSNNVNYSLYHSGSYWYVERYNIFPGIVAKKYDTSPGVAPCSTHWSEQYTLCNSIRSYCNEEPGIASHFELTRTFTATDACGNESTCKVYYTWTIDGKAHEPDAAAAPSMDEVSLNFKAYPVPFNKDVSLNYNFDFDTDVTIEVYDTKGLLVKSQVIRGYKAGSDVTLPMSIQGADQLYYVKLITNRGTVTKKIVSSQVNKQ